MSEQAGIHEERYAEMLRSAAISPPRTAPTFCALLLGHLAEACAIAASMALLTPPCTARPQFGAKPCDETPPKGA
jgi:hypothetical protein